MGAPSYAHVSRAGPQQDPDLLWTGSELVVAWSDLFSVRYRSFNAALAPVSGEQVLSSDSQLAGNVALATFNGSWAAAWRANDEGLESVRVRAGASSWTTASFPPSFEGDHPALVELDETHLLLFFSVGEGAFDAGPSGGRRLRVAVIDVDVDVDADAPGAIVSRELAPLTPPYDTNTRLRQRRPAAVRVGERIFLAWETESPLGDPLDSEVYLAEVDWSAREPGRIATLNEWLLSYDGPRARDQTAPALAASPLLPGGALIAVWDNDSRTPLNPPSPDLMLAFRPTPFVSLDQDAGSARRLSSISCADVFP